MKTFMATTTASDLLVVLVGAMLALLLLLTLSVSAQQPTVVFSDSFTDAVVPLKWTLTGQVPEVGSHWEVRENTCSELTVPFFVYAGAQASWKLAVPSAAAYNATTPLPGGQQWVSPWACRYSAVAVPAGPLSPDYEVRFNFREHNNSSPNEFWYLMARVVAPRTFYGAGLYHGNLNPDAFMFKVVDGVYTQLASGNCDVTTDGRILALKVQGDALTFSKDGVPCVSTQGGFAITDSGYGGWGAGNIRNASNKFGEGESIDDFVVTDLNGVIVVPSPSPTFSGTCSPATGTAILGPPIQIPTIACEPGESFTVIVP